MIIVVGMTNKTEDLRDSAETALLSALLCGTSV